jgi:gluconolactonase
MKALALAVLTVFAGLADAAPARSADDYVPGPDSKPHDGVPKGDVVQLSFAGSKIFPGTVRDYWLYVPKQYRPDTPACVYIGQDGLRFEAPTVFDNLIHKKEMPVTIGVFVMHGRVKAADEDNALDRFNRSYEYDGLGDNYARFLVEELLPAVEAQTAPDGRAIHLSHSANDRAIGGSSSGAIAAFTAAWERPSEFSRVFSAIGTYVSLRGGDRYPALIRKLEPKPIRVFLQDGSADNNKYGGDWWMANQTMERALSFAGYEVEHAWGDGGHTGKHATAVFPDAMRFLWKGWPKPVTGGATGNDTLNALLLPGQDWQLVGEGYGFTDGPAVNRSGEVFFNDPRNNKSWKVGVDGTSSEVDASPSKKGGGQAFGPDGRRYALTGSAQQLVALDAEGQATVLAEGLAGNDLVVAHNGNVYVTDSSPAAANAPTKVWLVRPGGAPEVVDSGLKFANGVALSPDQTLLYVADYRSHWVYSYQVQADGTLAHKQPYYWLHTPDTDDDAGADGLRVDREGRLYVATRMGIQVCDQAGRVQCILPLPNGKITNLSFGGPRLDTLYATSRDKVYRRQLKVQGVNAWDAPIKPAAPRL